MEIAQFNAWIKNLGYIHERNRIYRDRRGNPRYIQDPKDMTPEAREDFITALKADFRIGTTDDD